MSQAKPAERITLTLSQFQRLEKLCGATAPDVRADQNDPAYLGYQLGVQKVLKVLRDGFVVEG